MSLAARPARAAYAPTDPLHVTAAFDALRTRDYDPAACPLEFVWTVDGQPLASTCPNCLTGGRQLRVAAVADLGVGLGGHELRVAFATPDPAGPCGALSGQAALYFTAAAAPSGGTLSVGVGVGSVTLLTQGWTAAVAEHYTCTHYYYPAPPAARTLLTLQGRGRPLGQSATGAALVVPLRDLVLNATETVQVCIRSTPSTLCGTYP